ncbi:hypothetical protein N480_05665 [Pseudoalteromonas luteoviolacea S2607]|nr:hypothetical protein N480_05665 [Pseudoalteromonas luteoviolacea S2607]
MLQGIMMSIVQRQLADLNIPQRHENITLARLSDLKGAAVINSWTPGVCVSKINSTFLPDSKQLTPQLHKVYNKEPAIKLCSVKSCLPLSCCLKSNLEKKKCQLQAGIFKFCNVSHYNLQCESL